MLRLREKLPKGGTVDILSFTDKQYEKGVSFRAAVPKKQKKHNNWLFSNYFRIGFLL